MQVHRNQASNGLTKAKILVRLVKSRTLATKKIYQSPMLSEHKEEYTNVMQQI